LKEYLQKNAKKAAMELQNSQASQPSVGSMSGSVTDSKVAENVTTKDLPGVSFFRNKLIMAVQIFISVSFT
jgi:hypothetical protein